jgi:CheY-like chemotaxis protein
MKTQQTVLVAEDEKFLRNMIVETLIENNYLALEAENGKETVKIALAKRPDLILLDLLMPVMDGMTALNIIRTDAWGKHVPVIILTNLSATNENLVKNMVTNKPMYYLIKSDWKMIDIVEKIKEVLK